MTAPWAQFWTAMAFMALSAALAANVAFGTPLEVGPISSWAAAIATTAAVFVALFNTNKTLRDAAEREANKKFDNDKAYLLSVYNLCRQVEHAIGIVSEYVSNKETVSIDAIRTIRRMGHLESIIGSIDRVPIHAAPDSELLEALVNIRVAAVNTNRKIEDALLADKPASLKLDGEQKFIKVTRTTLESKYPDLIE